MSAMPRRLTVFPVPTAFFGLLAFASFLPVASADDRADAESAVEKAIAARDKTAIEAALPAAVAPGDERAAKFLLRIAPKMRGLDVHDALLAAIRGITEDSGVDALADQAKSHKVSIVPAAPGHPLLRDVFPVTTWDASEYTWSVDGNSELLDLVSPGVVVLVQSPELDQKHKAPAVAVTFRWQGGRVVGPQGAGGAASGRGSATPAPGAVLHVVSHFEKQRDADSGDHDALQQLLLNFVLEKRHSMRGE